MRWPTAILLLVSTFVADLGVEAITVPIQGYRRSGRWWQSMGGVQGRDDEMSTTVGIVDLQDAGDLQYYMNITLGGRQFRVLVDSGSADLWVAGDVSQSESTGHAATITYNDGVIQGQVRTADLEIEGYTIPGQAYISEKADSLHPDGQGILGLGPSRLSSVLASLGGPVGDPPLDRLFRQVTSLPSYISILLGRSNDPDSTIPGQLTIGEVLAEYNDVQTKPRLPVERIDWDQHWTVALDESGIIGPDGHPIAASVGQQLKVIFDSGYTLPQVPKSVADAIYGRVPGARFVNISATATPVWTVPCSVELNVTFKFAGISYPVHPLDTVMDDLQGPLDSSGKPTCVGAFQPMSVEEPYDIVLGMAFLRNAYILMNFGDFVDGSVTQVGDPFVQLRSITDPAEAHLDFVQQRLGGIDTTGSQKLLPPNNEDNTKVTINVQQKIKQYLPWIISASILGGLLLSFGVTYFFIWRSGRRYRRLHGRAPSGIDDKFRTMSSYEVAQLLAEKALPNPYELHVEKEVAPLRRKVDASELMPNWRPYKTRSMFAVARESSISDTVRLLPVPPGSARSYETTGRAEPLISDKRSLPNPYAAIPQASPTESLPPPLRRRPLPDPYAHGAMPNLGEVFDVSRSMTTSIFRLPPLQFSSASLSALPAANSGLASQLRNSVSTL
ncbi:aspartic peptidase domain-containing protein [Trametes punicea]|nr:aspartic peptidase domain-containing protein [Trametes punicea]